MMNLTYEEMDEIRKLVRETVREELARISWEKARLEAQELATEEEALADVLSDRCYGSSSD